MGGALRHSLVHADERKADHDTVIEQRDAVASGPRSAHDHRFWIDIRIRDDLREPAVSGPPGELLVIDDVRKGEDARGRLPKHCFQDRRTARVGKCGFPKVRPVEAVLRKISEDQRHEGRAVRDLGALE